MNWYGRIHCRLARLQKAVINAGYGPRQTRTPEERSQDPCEEVPVSPAQRTRRSLKAKEPGQ